MAYKGNERNYAEMSVSEIIDCVIEDAKKQGTFTDRANGADDKNVACTVRALQK